MEFDLANHRPGDLLNAKQYAELKRLRGEGNLEKPSDTSPSSCSCLLDVGHWGSGGWHFWKPTLQDLIDSGKDEIYAKAAADRPWHIERCPQFLEACKRWIENHKAKSKDSDKDEERRGW